MSQTPAASSFLGLRFDALDPRDALKAVKELSRAPRFSYVVTPNVDHMVRLHETPSSDLWSAYRAAALRVCDSRILARLAKIAPGITLPIVTGSDLIADLLGEPLPAATRVALIGGTESQRVKLEAMRPEACWAQHLPPMGVRDDLAAQDAVIAFVEQTQAEFVLFAIGSPQSELLAHRIAQRGAARGVGLCIGAAIEFVTGEKRRAPAGWQRFGLEWLFRLKSEPRRLWRRYLRDDPKIFAIWLRRRGR